MVDNNVLVGGSVVMMLIVGGGITAFVLFGEDETYPVDRIFCRNVSCGSHLVNDESQRNTIVELKNATHVCCVEKQDENESSDDEDDDEDDEDDKSAFGFTISLVLLIAMVALVGFALRTLWKQPRKGGEGVIRSGERDGKAANGGERRLAATPSDASQSNTNTYKTTESGGGARSSAAPLPAPPPSASPQRLPQSSTGGTTGASKPEFSAFRPISSAMSLISYYGDRTLEETVPGLKKQVDEAKEDAFDFARGEINYMTETGMGLVLKISVVIGILIIMILIGVTVFQGQSYFSS